MSQYYNYQFAVSWDYEDDDEQPVEWGDYIGS